MFNPLKGFGIAAERDKGLAFKIEQILLTDRHPAQQVSAKLCAEIYCVASCLSRSA